MIESKKLLLFGLSLGVGFLVYQWSEAFTEPMRITLAIFVIAVILWITEWIPLFLTSLVVLFLEAVLLSRSDVMGEGSLSLFFEPFFSPVITLFLGGFALSHVIHKYEMDKVLAVWILRKSRGIPSHMVTFFLLFSAGLSMWISNTATTLLLMTLVLPILKPYAGKPFSKSILLAITVGSTIGGMVTPIGTPPNAIAMHTFMGEGVSVSFGQWFLMVFPICVLVLFMVRLGLETFFPVKEMATIPLPQEKQIKTSNQATVITVIFMITVCLWLTAPLHHISDGVVALVPVILLYLTRLLDPQDLKYMGWDTLLLVGGGMSLGVAIKESGLARFVLQQLMNSEITPSALLIAITLFSLMISTFISNTVATSLIVPLVMGLEANLIHSVLMIVLASSLALALPISSPSNAIIFSSGYIRSWDMIRIGGLVSIAGILILYLTSLFYWPILLNMQG